ncbi:hypothetical protein LSH36_110g02022 [Paralvinella palmiformis]|uniref:Ubiquitin-like domain-containing protein n=1 Tax=Paralvinella palmiformis TaxID=53620 RepID=A0AAD9JYU7_9ANNE|nr:hypothetical protein LSH36_110g02022 [Paralvinella palmiformis]
MLIYVESKAFPHRTFVVRVQLTDTIARVRAQILHILYEVGFENHQFRLRFKGEYLRDAYTVSDYNIVDNGIIKMVSLGNNDEDASDTLTSSNGSVSEAVSYGLLPHIKNALKREVNVFEQREKLLFHFKSLLYLHFLAGCLCFLTVYWYGGIWTLFVWLLATIYCPTFTRIGGYVGSQSLYKERYCILYAVGALICLGAALYFCVDQWIVVINHGCKDWEFVGDCSHNIVFTAVFYGFEALLLLVSICIIFILLSNMKIQYGDYVEKYLVQTRDIEDIIKTAKSGRIKEKRIAAFELATMAASGDDNKFRIVAEGGLDVLIQMALCGDEATQEHAVEAIAELITVPVIQENFIEMGGLRNLMALLHSSDDRLVYHIAMVISYVVTDSEDNKHDVITDHGLSDLSRAAHTDNLNNQRLIAGIFLELAFNTEVRGQMASLNTPAQALIKLCRSEDAETQRYALQSLELLAIESPETVRAQESLLEVLLDLPSQIFDAKVLILAGKILLYFAEEQQTCEAILDRPNCKKSLLKYAHTQDSILQKVVIKVIYSMLEIPELRYRVQHKGLDEVLRYIIDNAADRECWDMADQAIQLLDSTGDDSGTIQLPSLSTKEKLDRMAASTSNEKKPFSSKGSNGSSISLRSTLSSVGEGKGIK